MIKVEVIKKFTLADYKKLKNVKKVVVRKENEFSVGDTFDCDKKMADYLTGNNLKGDVVVEVIEVIPEEDVFEKYEEKIIKEEAQEKPEKPKKKKASKK